MLIVFLRGDNIGLLLNNRLQGFSDAFCGLPVVHWSPDVRLERYQQWQTGSRYVNSSMTSWTWQAWRWHSRAGCHGERETRDVVWRHGSQITLEESSPATDIMTYDMILLTWVKRQSFESTFGCLSRNYRKITDSFPVYRRARAANETHSYHGFGHYETPSPPSVDGSNFE